MSERYKFVGFSADFELYTKVESYVSGLIEQILASASDRNHWSFVQYMSESGLHGQQLARHRFQLLLDTVLVGCQNLSNLKGVRVVIHDPSVGQGAELSQELSVSYEDRPAQFSAFMDEFGIEGEAWFSRDLVIICELTSRTEAAAMRLIRRYLIDELSYEEMDTYAQASATEEENLWARWTGERSH